MGLQYDREDFDPAWVAWGGLQKSCWGIVVHSIQTMRAALVSQWLLRIELHHDHYIQQRPASDLGWRYHSIQIDGAKRQWLSCQMHQKARGSRRCLSQWSDSLEWALFWPDIPGD